MAKSPIERKAGQSIEEMACQMEAAKIGNRLYNQVSAELKAQQFDAIIGQQLELLAGVRKDGRVDLNNLEAVQATAERYLRSCQKAGIAPTMMALSAALGYCRKSLWQYINNNPETPSGRYLSILQTTFAAILAQLGLTRNTSEAVSIFLLKNSGQGLVDRAEVDISAKAESPLGEKADPEALRRKYLEDAYGLYSDDEES